jgi:hypothetical protein
MNGMATERPVKKKPTPDTRTPEESAEAEYDEIDEDLYLSPDGTMATYYEGDEDDEQSEWYHIVPRLSSGELLSTLDPTWEDRHADDPFWQKHPDGIDIEWKNFEAKREE